MLVVDRRSAGLDYVKRSRVEVLATKSILANLSKTAQDMPPSRAHGRHAVDPPAVPSGADRPTAL